MRERLERDTISMSWQGLPAAASVTNERGCGGRLTWSLSDDLCPALLPLRNPRPPTLRLAASVLTARDRGRERVWFATKDRPGGSCAAAGRINGASCVIFGTRNRSRQSNCPRRLPCPWRGRVTSDPSCPGKGKSSASREKKTKLVPAHRGQGGRRLLQAGGAWRVSLTS